MDFVLRVHYYSEFVNGLGWISIIIRFFTEIPTDLESYPCPYQYAWMGTGYGFYTLQGNMCQLEMDFRVTPTQYTGIGDGFE